MMKSYLSIAVMLVVFGTQAYSQTEEDQVQRAINNIQNAYERTEAYKLQVTYKVFKSELDLAPYETNDGFFVKRNGQHYNKLNGIESVSGEKMAVTVQHDTKTIVLHQFVSSSDPKKKKKNKSEVLPVDLSAVAPICEKVSFQSVNKDLGKLIFKFSNPDLMDGIEQIEVSFDQQSFFLKEIRMKYAPRWLEDDPRQEEVSPVVVIDYVQVNRNPRFSGNEFLIDAFVSEINGSWEPSEALSGFKIIDNTSIVD